MNKRERMEALFNQRETDYVPAGFWFHYPASYTVEKILDVGRVQYSAGDEYTT